MRRFLATHCLLSVLCSSWIADSRSLGSEPAEAPTTAATRQAFEKRVAPILQSKCGECHSGEKRKADLDLTTLVGVLHGGESGKIVVPGRPDESLLFEKVSGGEMPPDEKNPLDAAELQAIQEWIASLPKISSEAAEDTAPTPNQHDVLQIMLRRCTACHGRYQQLGKLDLRTRAAMLRGGKSGPAIVLGKAADSLLIQKIHTGQMPPRERLVEASVKPIETAETELLARWITLGAPEIAIEPDVASSQGDPLVSEQERQFWAFQPPRTVEVPQVRGAVRVANPIDAFVLAKLEPAGLSLAAPADRLTLMRRAYFDLTGLPPEPAEVEAYLADTHPQAYERLVDKLLSSPRYGERWGRYWLDLAGYADSEGKREQDLPRPHAWRYRDYVIRALNADKPYDRFLLEQIAGDELADYEHAPEITPEIYDNLVATGFLRMAPDPTWANITGYVPDRLEVIADEIDVLGSAVMGLTLKCARCHSHKFDPIPHRDYYRLLAVFKGAYDEYNWIRSDIHPGIGPVSQDVIGGRHLPFVTSAERQAWQENEKKLNEAIAEAQKRAGSEAEVQSLQAQRRPEPRVQALWDQGDPSPTYIYRRGDPQNPGRLVGPGVPSVLTDGKTALQVTPPWPGGKQTGRRLAFARWLTEPDHPLTARVAVNRIWKHHFGTGIVKTLGNFGSAGTRPTHPELLDWLALEFMRQGWSIKAMHRLMMNSATYQQSSAVAETQARLDPENALFSRMPLVRLDAEALYDTLLLVAGKLDPTQSGPSVNLSVRDDGLATPEATERGWRRLIYVEQQRKRIATHLENFDFPQMNPNCTERRDSMVAPQALYLLNNGMIYELAERFAQRITQAAGEDASKQVAAVYLIALSRSPQGEESRLALESINRFEEHWRTHLTSTGSVDEQAVKQKALTAFCHAILNSAAFLYVD